MRFSDIPAGAEVLFDANVLVYALIGSSPESVDLLARCSRSEVSGFATMDVLADTCHRLMLYEAFSKGLINRNNASSLQGKYAVIAGLSEYYRRVRSLYASGLAFLPLDEHRFHRAHALRDRHGLMTNDSLLLAAAEVFGIDSFATNDSDFDAVPWLNVYKPTDVP